MFSENIVRTLYFNILIKFSAGSFKFPECFPKMFQL